MTDLRAKGEQKLMERNCIKQSALQPGKNFSRTIRVEDSDFNRKKRSLCRLCEIWMVETFMYDLEVLVK